MIKALKIFLLIVAGLLVCPGLWIGCVTNDQSIISASRYFDVCTGMLALACSLMFSKKDDGDKTEE